MMNHATVSQILDEIRPPQPREIDLGPMRIEGAGVCWDNGRKKHVLTIRSGSSIISIVSSPTGASAYVMKDGIRLEDPRQLSEIAGPV